jgi:hypothetical protein
VGVRKGCEALVHSTRALLREGKKHSLQVDLINSFNLADRQQGLRAVETNFPTMAKWTETCYGHKARFVFRDDHLLSERGFHQGDLIAGLLFALVLHPIV